MAYYFIRVNCETGHNNPERPNFYVPGEPPAYPRQYCNYLSFCLEHNIVRIGWPDTGDLSSGQQRGKLAKGYDLDTVPLHVRGYLETFRSIGVSSTVLVPDKDHSGDVYIGTVTGPYHYHHDLPAEPYECAHRLHVRWDMSPDGGPVVYRAGQFGISIRGGCGGGHSTF